MTKKADVRRRRRSNWNDAGGSLSALRVILAPRFRISQHAVGLVERLHLILAAAAVGMAPGSHALVQSLEVSLRRALIGAQDARGQLLTLKLTHSDLAELVGASRQRITEQLSEFERTGVIIRDGRRLIIVTSELLALVHGDKPAPGSDAGPAR